MYRKQLAGIVLALIIGLGWVGGALAHAELVSSDPEDGATLAQPPAKITLVFDEEIDSAKSGFTVTDSGGTKVGEGKLDLDDIDHKTLTSTMDSNAGDGTYTINWTAYTADDDNTEEGTITFTVGAAQAQPTTQPTAAAQPTTAPGATAQPTTAPAATARPTTVPSNLPQTGDGDSSRLGYAVLGAIVALVGGILIHTRRARARR